MRQGMADEPRAKGKEGLGRARGVVGTVRDWRTGKAVPVWMGDA